MKKYLFFILILVLSITAFGQKLYHKKAQNMFLASDSCLADSNGIYYIRVDSAETVTSQLQQMKEVRSGNIRVSTFIDTISVGSKSTKIYVDIGLKVGIFGADSLNIIWTAIDSIASTSPRSTSTKEIKDFGIIDDPILGYYVRLRQDSLAVVRAYPQTIEYKPE